MKATRRWVLGVFVFISSLFIPDIPVLAQDAVARQATATNLSAIARPVPNWRAEKRSAHQTEWRSVSYRTNAGTGKVTASTNSYIELGTGLNYFDATTQRWEESKEEIEIVNGNASARKGQHKVTFAANINSAAAIQTVASDGKELKSHVLGLAYTDAATGQSVLIAAVQDSIGEVAGNQVIYRNAFDGPFKADLRYTYTKGGFEQDVIFRQAPPAPEEYGMDSLTARLEVWTEFLAPPQPVQEFSALKVEEDPAARAVMVDPDLTDETLNFGAMRIGAGTAFSLDQSTNALEQFSVPVGKDWLRIEGRDFLIEKVDFQDAAPSLEQLPAAEEANAGGERKQAALPAKPRSELLAELRPPARVQDRAGVPGRPMKTAALLPKERGFVLDYSQVNTPQANMVFKSTETYHVTAPVTLTGTTVIEGGTVVKFNAGSSLSVGGDVICRTELYRPAFFTARDDNSVGEIVSGSTGTPSGYYATYIFRLTTANNHYDFHNLRLRHGNQAFLRSTTGSGTIKVRHTQIHDCNRAFGNYYSPLTLQNVLVYRTKIAYYSSVVNYGENVTFHRIDQLLSTGSSQPPLQFKNTLLISCTNNVSFVDNGGSFWPGSGNNLDAGIFETSGLAHHYLPAGSAHRGQGATTIDANLLSDLKQTTTRAPILLTGTLAENKILGPDVTRNSTTVVDRGYAYPAMDYLAQNLLVEGGIGSPVTLLVTNGAVLGLDPLAGNYGIRFGAESELVSVGVPGNLNRFVPLQMIQENGAASVNPASYFTLLHGAGLGSKPTAFLRFTDLSLFASSYRHMNWWNGGFVKLAIQDSQIRGGPSVGMYLGCDNPTHSVGITNSLFDGVELTYHPYAAGSFHARNNLFKRGSLILDMNPPGAPVWTFYDNLFDGTVISQTGGLALENNYNAYVTAQTSTRLTPVVSSPNNHDQLLTTSPAYENGLFGSNYLPSTATQLLNQGSRAAADAGLFHYTTSKTPDSKEGNTSVDIGLHYVGATSANLPKDQDGDGFADYYEDRNGNGRHEMTLGERRWQGVPTDPIIKFSSEPVEYYPNAGLITLDAGVTVTDNFANDENFLLLTNLTVETAAGDFVRLLPVPNVLTIQNTEQVFLNGTHIARMTGGDGTTPLRFDFRVAGRSGCSLSEAQSLMRELQYVSDQSPLDDMVQRSVKATVDDTLAVKSSSTRQIRLFSQRPALIVDAGPDIAIPYSTLSQSKTIQGKVKALTKTEHVSVEWTLVEPALWVLDSTDINQVFGNPYVSCAVGSRDVLNQFTGNNPKGAFSADADEEVPFNLVLGSGLPLPEHNKHCWPGRDYTFEAWRYRFRLTARDGNRAITDEVVVRILPPNSNEMPEVNIRPPKPVKPEESIELSADVLNEPNETLSYLWTLDAPQMPAGFATGDFAWSPTLGKYTSTDPTPSIRLGQVGRFELTLCVTDSSSQHHQGCNRSLLVICTDPTRTADIIVAMDYSGSLGGQPLYDAESAILALISGATPELHRIGLVAFSGSAEMRVPLGANYQGIPSAVRRLVDTPDWGAFGTYISPALTTAWTELVKQGRPGAERVVVLLSDGFARDMTTAMKQADEMRRQGVRLITIQPVREYGQPEFFRGDLLDRAALLQRLKFGSDPVASYLRGLPGMEVLNGVDPNTSTADDIATALLAGLNRVIRGAPLHVAGDQANPFVNGNVTLSRRTRSLLANNPMGYDLLRANRFLLTDAFSNPDLLATQGIDHYTEFMSTMATSIKDAYVASSGGLSAVLARLAASTCAEVPPAPIVSLGEDITIFQGQQVVLKAGVESATGDDPPEIVEHVWSQYRLVQSSNPHATGANVPPLAVIDAQGANDSDVIVRDFPEAGRYVVQVEIRTSSGVIVKDSVVITVEAQPPLGEDYAGVNYITAIAGYDLEVVSPPMNADCTPQQGSGGSGTSSGSNDPLAPFPLYDCGPNDNPLWGRPCRMLIPVQPPNNSSYPGGAYVDPCRALGLPGVGNLQDFKVVPRVRTLYVVSALWGEKLKHYGLQVIRKRGDCPSLPHELSGGIRNLLTTNFNFRNAGNHYFWDNTPTSSNPCLDPLPCTELGQWRRVTRSMESWLPLPLIATWDPFGVFDMKNYIAKFDELVAENRVFSTTYQLPYTGEPWNIDAGSELNITANFNNNGVATVQLPGKLSHKRKPGVPFTATWSLESHPPGGEIYNGTTFTTASGLNPTVFLTQPGTYLFKIRIEELPFPGCSVGTPHAVEDHLTVNINAANLSAGPDQIIDFVLDSQTFQTHVSTGLQGTATATTLPVTWTFVEMPQGAAPFLSDDTGNQTGADALLAPIAHFDKPGKYRLRLRADSNIASDTVTILVNAPPVLGNSLEPAIYSLDPQLLASGILLTATVGHDDLPTKELTYHWECIERPMDAECFIANALSPATQVTFSIAGTDSKEFKFRLTVSDGRLSTSEERTFVINPLPDPVLTFELPSNTSGAALRLLEKDSRLSSYYAKVENLVPQPLLIAENGNPQTGSPNTAAVLDSSGRILRYTPPVLLQQCQRAKDSFTATFIDRHGNPRAGQINVVLYPPRESKASYERRHVFKYMMEPGQAPLELPLRDLLTECPNPYSVPLAISGPMLSTGASGPMEMETPLGKFKIVMVADAQNQNVTKETLVFEPAAAHSGVPLTETLTFVIDGAPGAARFEFLLLPSTSTPSPESIGGIDEVGTVEIGEQFVVTTFQTIEGSGPYWNYSEPVWTVVRLDGPQPTEPVVPVSYATFPSGNPDYSRATFVFDGLPGTYLITATKDGVPFGSSKVVVVPSGSLPLPEQPPGPFDDPEDPADTGLTVAVLVTKPGRAVIQNLPDPKPGLAPFEVKDGVLVMRGQAAAPVDADPNDAVICGTVPYSCQDATYKVFLYHAGYGEEVPFDQDDSANAIDLTPDLKFEGNRTLNLQGGWNLQLVSGQPGNDEIGKVDLSGFTNGNYFVQVWVKGRLDMENGTIQETAIGKSRKYPILLKTERKPGKVQFSETDFNLAAADGRLRVSRSYDSEMGPPSGSGPTSETPELGWGWSLSSFDLGVQLYEYRSDIQQDTLSILLGDDPEIGNPPTYNVRVKGAHHLTLNLPWNGRRVTFQQDIGSDRLPYWQTPEGESGQLDAPLEERQAFGSLNTGVKVQWFGSLSQYSRSQEQFDFSQFTLTGPDGTKYYLTRGEPDVVTWSAWRDDRMGGLIYPIPPTLTKVEFPDGATMERAFNGAEEILKYYPTRAVSGVLPTPITITVVRETQGVLAGKIKEIRSSQSPAGTTDTRPAVKYTFYQQADPDGQGGTIPAGDKRIGNLKEVKRLTRTAAGNDADYDVTTYYYKSSDFAHLINHVVNPLRLKSFEASWNTDGQLIMTKDAAGIERTVSHSPTDGTLDAPDGRAYTDTSTVEVPLGNQPLQNYNSGTSPKVKTITRSDSFGNVIQSTVQVDNGPILATTTRKFEETKLTSSTDAEGRTTSLYYNPGGRLEETRRPGGTVERIGYDELGMPSTVSDARRNVSSTLQDEGRPIESVDAKGNRTKTAYIPAGELKGRVHYIEDALGNRSYTTYYTNANAGDNPLGSVHESFLLEKPATGDFNLTDTTLRRNWTKSTYFKNGLLKTSTSTRTGLNAAGASVAYNIETEYKYDAQGRVTETIQKPSDNPFTTVNESTANHVTKQTYNALGKVETSTDKYGRITSYSYDERGNLTETLYPDNTITRTVYDVNNRPIYQQAAHLSTQTDPFGTHTEYDAFGRAVKTEKLSAIAISLVPIVNIDNQTVPGLYAAQLDSVGSVLDSTTTEYDAIGRVKKVIDVTGAYRRFAYADASPGTPPNNGNPAVPASLANKLSYVGDGSMEILVSEEQFDASGNVVISRTFDRNASNQPQTASHSSFEYDELNRQTKQTVHNLDGSVYSTSTTVYDALGRRTQTTDADDKVTDFAYDGAGRLRSVTEWLIEGATKTPVVTEYTYDEVGNLIVQKDALGRETKYEYDNFGRRIRRTLPGTQTEMLAYDVFSFSQLLDGNNKLVQRDYRTDFNNQTTRRNYDSRGRLIWKGTGDGVTPLAQFTYTPWGARQTMIDLGGTTTYIYGRVGTYTGNPIPGTFTYDSDQLIVRQRANTGAPVSTDAFLYEHDAAGNLKRVNTKYTFTLSGNSITAVSAPNTTRTDVRYEYDSQHRLNKVRQGSDNAELASYIYSDPGVLEQATYTVPVLHHAYAYNVANQLLNVVIDQNGTQIRKFDYNPAGHELAKSGQRKAAWEYGAPNSIRRAVNYTQDSLQRLIVEDIVEDNIVPNDEGEGTVSYTYDTVGNRLSRQTVSASTSLPLKILNFALPNGTSHDANDRLPAPEVYDNNGNTLKGDIDGVAGVEQTANDVYDLEDRLTTSTRTGKTVTLAYDGDGNRTRKDVTVGGTTTATRYVVDDRTPSGYAQVMEEWQSVYNGTSWSAWTLARKYTYGLSRIRQERLSGGAVVGTEYYGYDGHGNVALLTDAAGTVGNTYSYDAYGVLLSQGGNTPNHYQYSGEQWDSDLGMYYLRARYLNPQSGRFWAMDTFEGNSSTPLSLHKYLYAHANPVNGIDPSGHEFTILGVSVAMTMSQSLQLMHSGVVSAVGAAARATLFGAMAGKSANEILTEFVLDETGISTLTDAYSFLSERLAGGGYDQEEADLLAYSAWQAEVLYALAMTIPEGEYGEYDIEFEPQCFTSGTLVATESGLVTIENIKVGDSVWAWNEVDQQPELRSVLSVFVRFKDEIILLEAGNDTIQVTPEHPFYTVESGWTRSRDLSVGEHLVSKNQELLRIASIRRQDGKVRVYNFEVDRDHTYFVGFGHLLCHNASAINMAKKLGILKNPYLEAHHIVSRFAGGAAEARDILRSVGVSLESTANGVALPATKQLKAKLKNPKWKNIPVHRGQGIHSDAYYAGLTKELADARAMGMLTGGKAGAQQAVLFTLKDFGGRIKLGMYPGYKP